MKKPILLGAFLFLCGYWFALIIGVPALISSQVNKILEQGYDIQYTESYVGKSPLLMAWKLSDPSVQTKNNKDSPWRLQLPDILLELSPLNPFAVNISSSGDFEFQEGSGLKSTLYSGTIQKLLAEANVTLSGGLDGVSSALELMNITVPGTLGSPLGTTIEKLALEAEVKGEITIGRLQETMKNWFENDGLIEIKNMALTYGPARMSVNGSISLDKDLQPVIYLKTQTTGLHQVADLAVEQGYYSSRNRTEAHNALDAFSLKGNEQTGPILELVVNMQDQIVSAGEMRLTKMDKIDW